MKKITLLVVILTAISCGFNKEIHSKKNIYYRGLDSTKVLNEYNNFTIKISKDWYSYKDVHSIIFHSPKDLKEGDEVNFANNFHVLSAKSMGFDENSSKDFSNFLIEKRKKQYKDFEYEIQEYNHVKYGTCKVLKYLYFSGDQKKGKIEILIQSNSSNYNLVYNSYAEHYDEYLPDFLKMVDSFEIIESKTEE